MIYQLYDSPVGLTTFSAERDLSILNERYRSPITIPATRSFQNRGVLKHGEELSISVDGRGAVVGVALQIENFVPDCVSDLWLKLCFDGMESAAPLGTFFGCEYAGTPAALETAFLTFRINGKNGSFENRFPMPFFEGARIVLLNKGGAEATITQLDVRINDKLCYDRAVTGLFAASPYYAPTENISGKNSVIADIEGQGHLAYGVASGHGIMNEGCEGDVRVFIDDVASPAVESDGSESWASYGWGFVSSPQCNPFSCYNGVPNTHHTWSECRLTFSDSYPFRSRFRFELEHGGCNNGGGAHSGQCFFYLKPSPAEHLLAEFYPDDIQHDGVVIRRQGRFENGIHDNFKVFDCVSEENFESFSVALPEKTGYLLLKRVSFQDSGPMIAEVLLDGKKLDREWTYTDYNDCYDLLEDEYIISAGNLNGKQSVRITVKPKKAAWNFCRYKVFYIPKKP